MEAHHIHHQQKTRDKAVAENKVYLCEKEDKLKQQGQQTQSFSSEKKSNTVLPIVSPASPPSNSSSPNHEFSFTVSLNSSSTPITGKSKTNPPSFAIDLSPADDIFFHGHLLPLHLLSHLPVSPRSSTNSLDSFNLPIKNLLDHDNKKSNKESRNCSSTSSSESISKISNNCENRGRIKSKSFSLFGLRKWRKGFIFREREEEEDKKKKKKRLRFDVSHVVKKYMRMVKPLLLFRERSRRANMELQRETYTSLSGNIAVRNKQDLRGRRGEFSAPASIRTSPTNSGLLVESPPFPSSYNCSDSTMEELQAAIQAAIAHCKNSISKEEMKLKNSISKEEMKLKC